MIAFISPFSGESHLVFESSILSLYSYKYPKEEIVLIGEIEHVKKVLERIKHKIKIKTIKIKNNKFMMFLIFIKIIFGKYNLVVHLAPDSTMSIFGGFLAIFSNLDYYYMHGYWRDRTVWYGKILHFMIFYFFINLNPNTKIVVLGEWVLENIKKEGFLTEKQKKRFHWINNPYLLNEDIKEKPLLSKRVAFGFLGKQSARFKKINSQDIEEIKKIISISGAKTICSGEDMPSYSDYVESFLSCDYIILLYPDKAYNYRCSGIIIESFVYKKPILCLKSDMTDYFFKKYGNIGYQLKSVEELKATIQKIILSDQSLEYRRQINNLSKGAKDFTDLKSMVKKHPF